MGSVTPICSKVAASGTSLFQHETVSSTHNPLGVVTLRAQVSLTGARGAGLFEEWVADGNVDDFDAFLAAASESVRPRFKITTLQIDAFSKPEAPLESEVQALLANAASQPGDRFIYEPPSSVNNQTMGKVRYQWLVNEEATGPDTTQLVAVQVPMELPVYLRKVASSEVHPGFSYKYDSGNGLFPTVWFVNTAGTPIEMYINPGVDYSIIEQAFNDLGGASEITPNFVNDLIAAALGAPDASTMTFTL